MVPLHQCGIRIRNFFHSLPAKVHIFAFMNRNDFFFLYLFFIIKIVPVFADIFASFQVKLPPLTQAIIVISNILVHHLAGLIITLVTAWFSWGAYTSTDAGQETKERKLPDILSHAA